MFATEENGVVYIGADFVDCVTMKTGWQAHVFDLDKAFRVSSKIAGTLDEASRAIANLLAKEGRKSTLAGSFQRFG